MSESSHDDHNSCSCHKAQVNPSVHQSLDELSFERSIFQAAIDNNVDKIRKLANAGDFDVNATDNYGYTALHYASRNGSMEAAKYLVGNLGADLNFQTRNLSATALHRAVSANKVDMVKYLIAVGANPHLKDIDGLSPKERAEKDKREQIIQIFQS